MNTPRLGVCCVWFADDPWQHKTCTCRCHCPNTEDRKHVWIEGSNFRYCKECNAFSAPWSPKKQ